MPNPGKGVRAPITVRVPPEHKETYLAEAALLGLELSDYLALRLAEQHALDEPLWIRRAADRRQQQELPLTTELPEKGRPVAKAS
jgi:hypothetical protein